LTNRCLLRCAHCGTRSGPEEGSDLDAGIAQEALEAASRRSCQVVNLSGGEPFLRPGLLARLLHAAADRGMVTRVSTGLAWCRSYAEAGRILRPLAQAGLAQIFLSLSDPHQAQVPAAAAVEATRAARRYGIDVTVVPGITCSSRLRSGTVRRLFEEAGVATPWVMETPLIPFGRGEGGLPAEELILRPVETLAGPCASLAVNPTLYPDGTVTGCAVIFGRECPPLVYGRAPPDSLDDAIEKMDADPLARWIRRKGVVALKSLIQASSRIRLPDRAVNLCHLCGEILSDARALAVARACLGGRR
jgi:MoaA/NifB/PqqE/SkfB family radical SAM enzyme